MQRPWFEGTGSEEFKPFEQQPSSTPDLNQSVAILLQDTPNWLSDIRDLQETDLIILLTPVVFPTSRDHTDVYDPFEALGRSFSNRHARIRQVPYTQRDGITSTHVGFIKRGRIIVLCFAPSHGNDIKAEFADIVFAVSENKPIFIVVCCKSMEPARSYPFPTVIQVTGYSPPILEATAALIFGDHPTRSNKRPDDDIPQDSQKPRSWTIEQWNEVRDVSSVMRLWAECISRRFTIDQQTLCSLLRRPGYAKHYVARNVNSGEVIGFCATYLSYVDQEGENLIASLALILVDTLHRSKGIGLDLHNHAKSELRKTRGVICLQLGSTFPRILYGPPSDMTSHDEWLHRRGWELSNDMPGKGQSVYDFLLTFEDWKYVRDKLTTRDIAFRVATCEDTGRVLEIVNQTMLTQAKPGWYDQYLSLMDGPNFQDIILATEHGKIIAVALTYTPSCRSQVASSLPWAGLIGSDVGGITCMCLPVTRRDELRNGLLDTSITIFKSQGMKRLFLDAITDGVDSLTQLGFQEWARYRDVQKDV